MSLFNQMIRGGLDGGEAEMAKSSTPTRRRTFKENIQDQIAYHKCKVADLEAVRDSLSPELEKFVEALQKLG